VKLGDEVREMKKRAREETVHCGTRSFFAVDLDRIREIIKHSFSVVSANEMEIQKRSGFTFAFSVSGLKI